MRLVGVIVAFEVLPSRFVFVLDDSSGLTIDVTCARAQTTQQSLLPDIVDSKASKPDDIAIPQKGKTQTGNEIDLHDVDIGTVVKIKGTVGSWRCQRQILLERLWIVRSTTEESTCWAENFAFGSEVLSRPWKVGKSQQKLAERKSRAVLTMASHKTAGNAASKGVHLVKSSSSKDARTRSASVRSELDHGTYLRQLDRKERERLKRERELAKRQNRSHCESQREEAPASCGTFDEPRERPIASAHRERRYDHRSEGLKALPPNNENLMDAGKQTRSQREQDKNERKVLYAANRALKRQC